jgi:hypothetical protein
MNRIFFFLLACSVIACHPHTVPAIGAEKLASGDPKAIRAAAKAPKFKGNKM